MKRTSPERWQEIEALLDRVLDAPEPDREAILATADASLRREVEQLLEASERAGGRFEEPPLLVARDVLLQTIDLARDQVASGDEIGAYRITRLLGRGGMGAVYEAERADGAFEKKVAIKIVKRGMDTDEIIRRFRHERQILARLEHPNIAGIIDGGITNDGLPYFVMELAQGEQIDRWCDAHTLLIRERLELFENVCEAVQYAHGNLIVHRDIKPGNIVVAADGVKLLDFGIAKLLGPDSVEVTQLKETRMTPQYAAPEQLRGMATTTATDVYSLGVLLYELLSGRPPYRLGGRTLVEMEQIICRTDPVPPSIAATRWKNDTTSPDDIARRRGIGRASTLQLQLRGDLDAICLKALCKAPDERYVSASALADDIRRYLEGRAVRAHPPTRTYRLRKFVRRNRTSVTLGTVTATALVGALVTATLLGRQAVHERDLRKVEAERATAAIDFILGTLAEFDPDVAPGQYAFTAHDLVELGLANLDRLDLELPLKASVMNTLAQVAFNLGERSVADSLYRSAHDILELNGGGADLAVSMQGMGQVLQRDGRYEDAVDWYRRALDLRRSIDANQRSIAESQRALAFASYNIGTTDRFSETERREALSDAGRLYSDLLLLPDSMQDIRAGALEGLADIELYGNDLAGADSLYNAAIAVWTRSQSSDHPDVARAQLGLVAVRLGQGRPKEAEQLCQESIAILRKAYGSMHRDLVVGYSYLGLALLHQEQYERAATALRQAAVMSDSVHLPGHRETAEAWEWYADVRARQGMIEESDAALHRALAVYFEGVHSRPDSMGVGDRVAAIDTLLARRLVDGGRAKEAIPLLRQAASMAVNPAMMAVAEARLGEAVEKSRPVRGR